MELSELREEYIDGIYQSGALLIRRKPFQLKSGGTSHIYLNHRNFLTQAQYLQLVAKMYDRLLFKVGHSGSIASVDSLMSPIITGAMSVLTERNIVVVRKRKLEHGTEQDVYGAVLGEIALVDDMTSTGGTLIEAAQKLRDMGALVRFAVVSASRDLCAAKNLEAHGIQLLSIANFDQIFAVLGRSLNEEERTLVANELH